MININENNFYLTLNVETKLYSSLAHNFEFIIADNSTDYRNIVLSNIVIKHQIILKNYQYIIFITMELNLMMLIYLSEKKKKKLNL